MNVYSIEHSFMFQGSLIGYSSCHFGLTVLCFSSLLNGFQITLIWEQLAGSTSVFHV